MELSKDINGNLYVNYNEIPPYDYEVEYFTIKNKLSIKHEILYKVNKITMENLT